MRDRLLKDDKLLPMVQEESIRQVEKWGIQDRSPFEWLAFLHEESGELACAISEWKWRKGLSSHVAREAIQTATLALKIAEMFLADSEAQ